MRELLSIKQRFGIVSASPLYDQVLETAVRVAPTDLTVLITGESGVGKEAFSKVIHAHSARKHNPFIAINCGAIPEGTINSELFGHEKGAFTGATGERKGYFETVNGGTIFLDEVGEMPLDTQAFLLRVLESGEFIRVGSSKTLKTDVRVVAATNVDLRQRIRNGRFREDLYYRLNTVPIAIPPLRERPEDIHLLFRKFSVDFSEKYRSSPIQLDERARQVLQAYHWPGNIRELKNLAEQLSVLSEDNIITEADLQRRHPHLFQRPLPSLASQYGEPTVDGFKEREILYKLLFEMKGDLHELKKLVFELIRSNDLQVSDARPFLALKSGHTEAPEKSHFEEDDYATVLRGRSREESYSPAPVFMNDALMDTHHSESVEVLGDTLSLEDMEKDIIRKALKKYRGKRKEAADELGISERTLYRKIKQYDL